MCHTKRSMQIRMLTPSYTWRGEHRKVHLRVYNDDFDAHRFLQRHLKVPKSLFAIDFVLSDIGSESADKKK